MDEMKIDTEKIRNTANAISNYNKSLDEKFQDVKIAMSYTFNNWVSPAKDFCDAKFNRINRTYIGDTSTSRYSAIQSYVKFLKEYIGDTYDEVENNNVSLADAFK